MSDAAKPQVAPHYDAPERLVHLPVGGLDGRLYLDLHNECWRVVEIDDTGWRVIDRPPQGTDSNDMMVDRASLTEEDAP